LLSGGNELHVAVKRNSVCLEFNKIWDWCYGPCNRKPCCRRKGVRSGSTYILLIINPDGEIRYVLTLVPFFQCTQASLFSSFVSIRGHDVKNRYTTSTY